MLNDKFKMMLNEMRRLGKRLKSDGVKRGGWGIPFQPSGYIRPNFGSDIPVFRARHQPTSKHRPHQGAKECARRRRQLGLGEFRPGKAA